MIRQRVREKEDQRLEQQIAEEKKRIEQARKFAKDNEKYLSVMKRQFEEEYRQRKPESIDLAEKVRYA